MPATSATDDWSTRRRVLGILGTAAVGSLAGCSGRLPGSGPELLDTETVVDDGQDPRLQWRYPPREDDQDGIGYAEVETRNGSQRADPTLPVRLRFSSTIGGIASNEPYTGYYHDWFRFRIEPPTQYEGRLRYEVRVEPPGQWDAFSAAYDIEGGVRRTTLELRNLETQGTIRIPAVFDPTGDPIPDRLHCSFTVQASRRGRFGKTVRVSDRGTLPLRHLGQQ